MAELKPCPFCGSSVDGIAPYPLDDEQYAVCCPKCNAQGGYNGGNDSTSPAEAIAAWNTRTSERTNAALLGAAKCATEPWTEPIREGYVLWSDWKKAHAAWINLRAAIAEAESQKEQS